MVFEDRALGIVRVSLDREGRTLMMGLVVAVLVAQSCPTLGEPTNYSLPGSSVHGIFQTRILEWVAVSFSKAIHIANLFP